MNPEEIAALAERARLARDQEQMTHQMPSAEVLADMARRAATARGERPDVGHAGGMSGAALDGILFGFGDEYMAGLAAVSGGEVDAEGNVSWLNYGAPFSERYQSALGVIRDEQQAYREDHPFAAGASEVGGAVLPAIATLGMSAPAQIAAQGGGRGLGWAMTKGAALGAGGGGLYGFGEGGEGDVSRLEGAAGGAEIGGAAGAAIPAIGRGLVAASRPVRNVVGGVLDVGSEGRANRALAATLRTSGQTPDEIGEAMMRAAQDGQGMYRPVDALGHAGRRRLSGVVRGVGGEDIADLLDDRQFSQRDRLAEYIADATGTNKTARQVVDAMTSARGEAADAAYSAARTGAGPVDVRQAVQSIDDFIGDMPGSGVAGDSLDGRLAAYRSQLTAPADALEAGVTERSLSDFDRVLRMKQSIQDDIGSATRAGRGNEARVLRGLMGELDAALEDSSAAYRSANDGFAEASRVIGAVDEGADMARPAIRAEDALDRFRFMTGDQQSAARIGFGDVLQRDVARAAPGVNASRPMTRGATATKMDEVALDPDLWGRRVAREGEMFETRARATGGSMTADNLAEAAAVQSGDIATVGALASGNIPALMGEVARRGESLLMGRNERTRRLIAEALLADDVEPLKRALAGSQQGESRMRQAEALARALMRPATAN